MSRKGRLEAYDRLMKNPDNLEKLVSIKDSYVSRHMFHEAALVRDCIHSIRNIKTLLREEYE